VCVSFVIIRSIFTTFFSYTHGCGQFRRNKEDYHCNFVFFIFKGGREKVE